jgi:hypothetical protein
MAEPKVLISKKSIRTMGKDMVRIKRGDLDVGGEENRGQKALAQEVERRRKEEERLISLQKQGDKIVEQARGKKVEDVAVADRQEKAEEQKREEQKKAEEREKAKRLAAFQEERRKAEQKRAEEGAKKRGTKERSRRRTAFKKRTFREEKGNKTG